MRSRMAALSAGAASMLMLANCRDVAPPEATAPETTAPSAKPLDTVPRGQLAFVGADLRIHLLNLDGSGDRTLTDGASGSPAWSPDGARLAFTADSALYLMNADGSGVVRLIVGGTEPTWSPDGRRVAFAMLQRDSTAGDSAAVQRIGVVNVDGSGFAWVSAGPRDFSPAWSPDGRTIAFVRDQNDEITPSLIYEQAVDQPSSARMITFLPAGFLCASSSPAWAPDGRLLLWSFCAASGGTPPSGFGGAGFAIGNGDGSGVMTPIPSSVTETYYSKPAWSPDGAWIAFSSPGYGVPDGGDILYLMRSNGSKTIQLTVGTRPAWRPSR